MPKVICCVCKKVIRDGVEPVSHSYCEKHYDEAIAEIKKYKPDHNQSRG